MTTTECTECGEFHSLKVACRSVEEMLAEVAPPADWADRERARRVAGRDRMDAILLGR